MATSTLNTTIPLRLIDDPERGKLPREIVYAAEWKGQPDDETSLLHAKDAAGLAYMLGFDTSIEDRIVAGVRVPGSYILRILPREG